MESVVDKCRSAVELLTVQYRMNEAIMRFSSDWFYGGRLQAAEEVKCRGILDFDSPVEWLDTSEMDFSENMCRLQVEGSILMRVNLCSTALKRI